MLSSSISMDTNPFVPKVESIRPLGNTLTTFRFIAEFPFGEGGVENSLCIMNPTATSLPSG
jgi:hypothetical protein